MAFTGEQPPNIPANPEPEGPAPIHGPAPPPTHSVLLPVARDEYWQSPSPSGALSWDEVEMHTTVEPEPLDDPPHPNEHQWQRLTDTRSDRRFTISGREPDSVIRCDRKITVVRDDANRLSLRVDVGIILATRSDGQQDWYETKHLAHEWSTEVAIPLPPPVQEGQIAAKGGKKKEGKTGKAAKHSKKKQKGESTTRPRTRSSVNRACPFVEESDTA